MGDATTDRKVVFWSTSNDEERLYHTSPEDAVEAWLDDQVDVLPEVLAEHRATHGNTITAYGFARMQISEIEKNNRAGHVAEDLIERLEEDYGDPEGCNLHDVTDAMMAAARTFVDAVLADYEMWACECVCEREVVIPEGAAGG